MILKSGLPRFLITTFDNNSCVHKTVPKSSQAKEAIHEIWQAETKINAEKAELFIETYQDKYPKTTLSLQKDREELAFYDFP